jgi:exonuclease III
MRVITWNCNMAYRRKAAFILKLEPDIIVLSECEQPSRLLFDEDTKAPADIVWHGTNPHKGLAVVSYGNYKLELMRIHNPDIKTVLPVKVTGKDETFIILAIWAYNPLDTAYVYIGQVLKALEHYKKLFRNYEVLLMGDFNGNVIWDKPRKKANFSDVIKLLEAKGIKSVYHAHLDQTYGKEEWPTFYLHRNRDKPYHLDYCFASGSFLKRLISVEIGKYDDWTMHSDHSPIIVTFAE